jgi:hypothetical protein
MGNLKVVHDTVFAMGRREDFDFEVVVATPEIEAVVGSPVEVEGGEGDFEIGDGEEFPPLERIDGEVSLKRVFKIVASGEEAVEGEAVGVAAHRRIEHVVEMDAAETIVRVLDEDPFDARREESTHMNGEVGLGEKEAFLVVEGGGTVVFDFLKTFG